MREGKRARRELGLRNAVAAETGRKTQSLQSLQGQDCRSGTVGGLDREAPDE
jgi:hypothetical protein